MKTRRRLVSAAALILLSLWLAPDGHAQRRRPVIRKEVVPFTTGLPAVDKVELLRFKVREEAIDGVLESKVVEGAQAKQIASLWRTQEFSGSGAVCHYPVYGMKFYAKDRLVAYASVCWACHNIHIREPDERVKFGQGFAADRRKGKALLKVFTDAFPEGQG